MNVSKFIDVLFDEAQRLNHIAVDLMQLATAFSETGNNVVADRLFDHAAVLSASSEKLRQEYAADQQRALDRARREVGGILSDMVNAINTESE